ncbi:MAG: phosphoglucosamine mutase [Clostridia bacterium]|jgi:phosphoglucosamine mutase|nr:phosphoglucosamine mutase [Clostridia bacterium]
MARLFGTDGVRGEANRIVTPELAFRLGKAGGYLLAGEGQRSNILIGKDTRISGGMLEAALVAGLCSVGVDARLLGVIPTPAVAFLTRETGAAAGIVISASHNPFGDNGIKFFGPNGFKLPDAREEEIEDLIQGNLEVLPKALGAEVGRVEEFSSGVEEYLAYLESLFQGTLQGLKIVVDCANGAASQISPRLFRRLGGEVVSIFDQPDGININHHCGSTHPEALCKAVVEQGAHLGLAHDGDADRLLAVDEKGNLVDGDQIMMICARFLKEQNKLENNTLVVTVMSNLGLRLAMEEEGITVRETRVGDRYVLEEMLKCGAVLGGEQSGHIIFLKQNTTGDGLITALNLLQVMVNTGLPLSQLASRMQRFPQVMVNIPVPDKEQALASPRLAEACRKAEERLGKRGRILIRPSGTEPVIRIMAEGPNRMELEDIVGSLAEILRQS